jgi:hypothetical protein
MEKDDRFDEKLEDKITELVERKGSVVVVLSNSAA